MIRKFRAKIECVVAAIGFDDHSDAIIQSGIELCRRTGMNLRLLHVCPPEEGHSYLLPYFAHSERMRLEEAIQKSATELAVQRLSDLKCKIPQDIEVSTRVMVGDPAEWINADAVSSGGAVIMIGVGSSQSRFIPKSWSTALSLMAHSSLPVLVIDQHNPLHFETSDRFKILVADDLSENSHGMLNGALQLAVAVKNVDFYHMHASALTEETIAAALQSALAAAHSEVGSMLSPPALHATIKAQIRTTMQNRIGNSYEVLEALNGRYHSEIIFGNVRDRMREASEKIKPNLMIFGRHQSLHRRPLLIGNVPFQAMVALKCPVMVIP